MFLQRIGRMVGYSLPTFILIASSLFAQSETPDGADNIEENWCYTQIKFQERAGFDGAAQSPAACFQYGSCDDPGTRNGWIPGDSTAVTYIRMVIHILRNDNGGNDRRRLGSTGKSWPYRQRFGCCK